MTKVDCLKSACDNAIKDPDLQPKKLPDGELETHCNWGVEAILSDPGWGPFRYRGFAGLTADRIHAAIIEGGKLSGEWLRVQGDDASRLALLGCRVIAILDSVQLGQSHGHVAVLYPAPMVYSPKRGRNEPMLANIGLEDKVEGANFAFHIEPEYYALRDDVPFKEPA